MKTQEAYYSKLCTEEFLFEAWKAIKSKNAAGGIDGVTLACFDDHVQTYDALLVKYEELSAFNARFRIPIQEWDQLAEDYLSQLVGQEAQGAVKYWGYIQELLSDDEVGFVKRERKGASGLVNCMQPDRKTKYEKVAVVCSTK